jgi:uncharacterized protein (UPF0335 family)
MKGLAVLRAGRQKNNEAIDVERLKPYIERARRLREEVNAAQEAFKDLMTEIKAVGYNTKHVKKAMKVEEIGYETYESDDQEFHLYLHALGLIREEEPVY